MTHAQGLNLCLMMDKQVNFLLIFLKFEIVINKRNGLPNIQHEVLVWEITRINCLYYLILEDCLNAYLFYVYEDVYRISTTD